MAINLNPSTDYDLLKENMKRFGQLTEKIQAQKASPGEITTAIEQLRIQLNFFSSSKKKIEPYYLAGTLNGFVAGKILGNAEQNLPERFKEFARGISDLENTLSFFQGVLVSLNEDGVEREQSDPSGALSLQTVTPAQIVPGQKQESRQKKISLCLLMAAAITVAGIAAARFAC